MPRHRQDPRQRNVQSEIGAVLVFGEQDGDIFMGTALREFLKEKYPNGASVNISHAADLSPNPAFAGSRAMAMTDWRIKDYIRERAEKGYGPGDELLMTWKSCSFPYTTDLILSMAESSWPVRTPRSLTAKGVRDSLDELAAQRSYFPPKCYRDH